LLVTPARRVLRTPWPWLGAALAALIVAPHIAWQAAHGWPTLEFVRNAQKYKIADQTVASFFGEIVGMMGPLTAPVWLAGLWVLLRGRAGVAGRVLGTCALVVVLIFLLQRSKPYYAVAIFPSLLAAGTIGFERVTNNRRWWRWVPTVVLLAAAAATTPMGLPILPVNTFIAYAKAIGAPASTQERHELGVLPQHYADMFGWRELAENVSAVYQSLPESEKASARVFARNYGQAGALEHYARTLPLPRVLSTHNNYWFWGPGPEGGTLIIIAGTREDNEPVFERLEEAGRIRCGYCMPYENGHTIWVGRGWRIPLSSLWTREKRFI
jgi:hypothetical protein